MTVDLLDYLSRTRPDVTDAAAQANIGREPRVEIGAVEEIPLTANGKLLGVISEAGRREIVS